MFSLYSFQNLEFKKIQAAELTGLNTVGVKKKATMDQVKLSVPHDKFWFKKW